MPANLLGAVLQALTPRTEVLVVAAQRLRLPQSVEHRLQCGFARRHREGKVGEGLARLCCGTTCIAAARVRQRAADHAHGLLCTGPVRLGVDSVEHEPALLSGAGTAQTRT